MLRPGSETTQSGRPFPAGKEVGASKGTADLSFLLEFASCVSCLCSHSHSRQILSFYIPSVKRENEHTLTLPWQPPLQRLLLSCGPFRDGLKKLMAAPPEPFVSTLRTGSGGSDRALPVRPVFSNPAHAFVVWSQFRVLSSCLLPPAKPR